MIEAAPTDSKQFVTIAEAAKELKMSDDMLMRYIRPGLLTGEIVSYRFKRKRVISWRSLLEYLGTHFDGAFQKRGKK